jgi:hypothetical protein
MAMSELVYDHLTTSNLNLKNQILLGKNQVWKYG